ncbi:hypothetical protein, partial [Pelomicrobium sp. G1]|uniref:hypothetical protein n=1 Tax=Pelomicrobium sp. G1 TaxID=3452920 RepID=UPI003F76B3D3
NPQPLGHLPDALHLGTLRDFNVAQHVLFPFSSSLLRARRTARSTIRPANRRAHENGRDVSQPADSWH